MLDDLILEANQRGWLLSNLYQIDDGTWRCNLRSATSHTAFATGFDAASALDAAMDLIGSATATTQQPTCHRIETGAPAEVQAQRQAGIATVLANLRRSQPATALKPFVLKPQRS